VLIGYQDNGSSNNGVSYVLDLSTETLKSIAGIAKEAGVESNVIDVVTQGECDFLSGLTPGSYYYSSATGFLSASVGDYEVGVAKSATNLLLNADIPKVDEEKIAFIDRLVTNSGTPSLEQARFYDFWKTREVKTTSGTFTVPSNVYAIGIFCLGKGGDATGSVSGGGGGLSMKIKRVNPGQTIAYTISGGIAICDGMTANPASGTTGGTASGGMYNYTGGSILNGSCIGGAGCGGNSINVVSYGGGSMAHWRQPSFPTITLTFYSGLGMFVTNEVMGGSGNTVTLESYGGHGFAAIAPYSNNDYMGISGGIGRMPSELGIFVSSDITGSNQTGNTTQASYSSSPVSGDWNGGGFTFRGGSPASYSGKGGIGAGGGFGSGTYGIAGGGGLGGGGGGGSGASGSAGNGGLGAGAGGNTSVGPGQAGYGGGGGRNSGAGGSSVVIFVF
jgi:hypothetical protein